MTYIEDSVKIAIELNLKNKLDVENFIICRLIYGSDFYRDKEFLSNNFDFKFGNSKEFDIYLARLANAVNKRPF